MVKYVDLNPVRAGMVDRIEDSDRSSVGLRIMAYQALLRSNPYAEDDYRSAAWLAALELKDDPRRPVDDPMYTASVTGRRASDRGIFPYSELEYFRRLDELAREVRPDKRGATPPDLPPVLERIGVQRPENRPNPPGE